MGRWRRGERDDSQLAARLALLEGAVGRIERQLEHHALPGAETARKLDAIAAATATVAALPPADRLVSVVMPTRNRAELLRTAIASVQAQTHRRWELLVVDDGSTDATPDVLAAVGDERVRALRSGRPPSPESARNLALGAARGDLVAYLDDDNLMGRHWLRAVVWAFDSSPDADVGYGARAVDLPHYPVPWMQLESWGRERLRTVNFIDQNVLAHRAGMAEARFDDGAVAGGDWELVLRLTAERPPLEIPVVAAVYRGGAPDRMSDRPDAREHWRGIQQDALRRWPLRLLILDLTGARSDELAAERAVLEAGGDVVEVVAGPLEDGSSDFEDAVRDFDPTAIAVRAARLPFDRYARIVRLRRPFYLRPSSQADFGAALDHPLCVGSFGPPDEDFRDRLLAGLDRVRAFQAELPPP